MLLEILTLLTLWGVAKRIAADVQEKANGEYEHYLEKRNEYDTQIRRTEREIANEIRSANAENFTELVALHYRSVKLGNMAHEAVEHARLTVGILRSSLREIYQAMEQLSAEYTAKRAAKAWDDIEQIKRDQGSLKELKTALLDQIGVVEAERTAFLGRVREFNSRTRDLKHRIRDLGPGGLEWFNRLERRTSERREQAT